MHDRQDGALGAPQQAGYAPGRRAISMAGQSFHRIRDCGRASTMSGNPSAFDANGMQMAAFSSLVVGLEASRSMDEAMDVLHGAILELGFPRVVYGCVSIAHLPSGTWVPAPLQVRGFPDRWDRDWPRHRAHDPYAHTAFLKMESTNWTVVQNNADLLDPAQVDCISYINDLGLNPGLTVPLFIPGHHYGFITAVGDGGLDGWDAAADRAGPTLAMIANYFDNFAIRRFGGPPKESQSLSKRELECLTWSARGKTVEDIAVILDLSADTVRVYLKRVNQKLDAVNRSHAVAKAMCLGMIDIS
ncbi:regulatory protein, LuxR [Rhizorhabdus wittichii RW1]|uniref:Regulatory protein, LuxR n=1 Tax=Rhizorhabdus wittichii (strain DSM 6014 / CCUG 31198 / JCM 15750 / NBRC 105917 / EY 4224 / RW1) TaxID=392499 RepID=A0A9J9LFP4_RHIWR|nr:regulatory protein, LuxR [Rhizorhabdus wittichii RW1]